MSCCLLGVMEISTERPGSITLAYSMLRFNCFLALQNQNLPMEVQPALMAMARFCSSYLQDWLKGHSATQMPGNRLDTLLIALKVDVAPNGRQQLACTSHVAGDNVGFLQVLLPSTSSHGLFEGKVIIQQVSNCTL